MPRYSRPGWRRSAHDTGNQPSALGASRDHDSTASLEFLKEILELAKEVVEAERGVDPAEERDRAKEALTELFKEAKSSNTHIIVERIVADIDDMVKKIRFQPQQTTTREWLVQKDRAGLRSGISSTPIRRCSTKHVSYIRRH